MNLLPYLKLRLKAALRSPQQGSDEANLDCPVCGDSGKYNLYYNVKKNKGKCFKCDTTFDALSLVAQLEGCSLYQALRILSTHDVSAYMSSAKLGQEVERLLVEVELKQEPGLPEIELPEGFVSVEDTDKWPQYLVKRIGSKRIAKEYGLGWCTHGYYKNRLIVPVVQEGKLVSFVARAMFDKCSRCRGTGCRACSNRPYRAYLYPKHCHTGRILFNYDAAKAYKHVVLTEGAFDAIRVGHHGMAVFGSSLSHSQLALLLASDAEEISLLFDPDNAGKHAARKSLMLLKDYYKRIRVVTLPNGKDPDEFRRDELNDLIKKTPYYGTTTSLENIVASYLT